MCILRMFSVNDIIWAKSSVPGHIFWPAKVIEPDNKIHDRWKKKPTVAYVNYLIENTYEAIKSESNVVNFNCDKKAAFLKKGRNQKGQESRLQFEAAVREAEKLIKEQGITKNTSDKSCLDRRKETISPQMYHSELSGGEDISKAAIRSNLNTSEMKAKTESKTKFNLPTIFEESNEMLTNSASTNIAEKKEVNGCETTLLVKRGRYSKTKNFTKVENGQSSTQSNLNEATNETKLNKGVEEGCTRKRLVLRTKNGKRFRKRKTLLGKVRLENKSEVTNACVVTSRKTTREPRSNSLNKNSISQMTETNETVACLSAVRKSPRTKTFAKARVSCSESNSSEAAMKGTQESCSGLNGRRIRFKNEVKARLQKKLKRSSEKKTKSSTVCVNGIKDMQGHYLETIYEECDSGGNETTPKRQRIEFENSTTSENGDLLLGTDIKRQRLESFNQDSGMVETEACISNEKSKKLDSFRQDTAVDIDENIGGQSNEKIELGHNSAANGYSPKDLDSSFESFKSKDVIGEHSFNDSGISSEKGAEILKCGENENKFEHLAMKGKLSDDEKDNDNSTEGNEDDSVSSDDESLPAAFSSSPDAKKVFRPGDVVWAKYWRDPFWPAQIARAHVKKKNFYVKFLPKSDGKCIKVRKKNIKPFSENRETYLCYKNQEIEPLKRKEFEESVDQAQKILLERVLGKNDCLGDIEDDQMSDLSSDDQSSLPGKVEQDEPVSEPEEPKVDTSEIEDENQELAGNNRSQRQATKYDNILNELHQCKQRLLDIYHEKIPSWRNKKYKHGTITERNGLKDKSGFGPIQDSTTCEGIINLLKCWYEAERQQDFITIDYVWDVWLPEALIYYIHITENISVEKAEEMYLDCKSYVDKQEVEDTRSYLSKQTIDQETIDETIEKAKRKLRHVLSS